MTTSEPRTLSDARFLLAIGSGLVALGLLWAVLTAAGQPRPALGALVGGGAVAVLAVVVRRRAKRRGPTADGALGRGLLGAADERDTTILTASLAWVGLTAFGANVVGLAAVALGADGFVVIGAIEGVLLAVLAAAWFLLARRN